MNKFIEIWRFMAKEEKFWTKGGLLEVGKRIIYWQMPPADFKQSVPQPGQFQ